jgi:hypothetical protein
MIAELCHFLKKKNVSVAHPSCGTYKAGQVGFGLSHSFLSLPLLRDSEEGKKGRFLGIST